jgi:tetratricopeptide (TPR) repeat protein
MATHSGPETPTSAAIDALLREAHGGGALGIRAARRAAALAERFDPIRAPAALRLVAQLDPLDAGPRLALARLAAESGDLDEARAEAAAVLLQSVDQAARARAAFILGEIARVRGEASEARARYETVLHIEDALLATARSDPTAARWYARARGRLAELDAGEGRRDRARAGAEGALAMLRAAASQTGEAPALAADIADAEMRLGALELDDNEPASARRRLGEAIARYEALAVTEQEEPHWRAVLADAWALAAEADYVRGAPDQARAAMDKALQARLRLAARHPGEAWALAGVWRVRGALRAALGDAEAAAESYQQARTLAEALCLRAPQDEAPARFLVHTLLDQADHALRTNQLNLAREASDSARMRAEAFAGVMDADPAWFGDAAACWDRLGETARLAQARPAALDAFARAVEFRRIAYERNANEPRYARGLAAALLKYGEAALESESLATARTAFNESAGLRLRMAEDAPGDVRAAHALAAALERVGLVAHAMGDAAAARAAWEDELALAEQIFAPDDFEGARFRAIVQSHLVKLGGADAEALRASALAHFDTLARAGALTANEAALRRQLWGN